MIINATHYSRKEGEIWIPVPPIKIAQISIIYEPEQSDINIPRINYPWCLDKWEEQEISAIRFTNDMIYDFKIALKDHKLNPWRSQFPQKELSKESALDIQEGGSHYKDFAIQPIEYIIKNSIPYPEGNVIKYVSRHSKKNGIEDIKKAIHYLKLIAELQYDVKL